MATLTAEDMRTWPKPNYDDPETLAPAIYTVNIICIVGMTIFVAGRFWSRTAIVKGALARDDWTMLAAYVGKPLLNMTKTRFIDHVRFYALQWGFAT